MRELQSVPAAGPSTAVGCARNSQCRPEEVHRARVQRPRHRPRRRRGEPVDAVFDAAASSPTRWRYAGAATTPGRTSPRRVRRRRSPPWPAGLRRGRGRRGRPGRPAVPHPLRVDAVRLRDPRRGAVTVPIYETSSAEQISWILSDSGARRRRRRVRQAPRRSSSGAPTSCPRCARSGRSSRRPAAGAVDELVALGADDPGRRGATHAGAAVRADDLATLIYTSGTTGRPKGCELTHRNLLAEVKTVVTAAARAAHRPAARCCCSCRSRTCSARPSSAAPCTPAPSSGTPPTSSTCSPTSPTFRPTFLLAVPRVFEKVYNGARQQGRTTRARAGSSTPRPTPRSPGAGRRTPAARRSGCGCGTRCSTGSSTASCAPRVGGQRAWPRCPAAPRSASGSGTSSAASACRCSRATASPRPRPAITLNTLGRQRDRHASGGRCPATPSGSPTTARSWSRGPIVFRGYWKNEPPPPRRSTDGWFHTGDIGELDDAGFLTITGRKKEIIVTAGGKNVAPAVLEDRLRAHPLVSQCMVVGDGQPFIAALVTIDAEALPGWRERNGKPAGDGRRRPGRRPRPARGDRRRGRRGEQGGVAGRADPRVPDPAGGLHRGGRRADARR